MCGIALTLLQAGLAQFEPAEVVQPASEQGKKETLPEQLQELLPLLASRGPDLVGHAKAQGLPEGLELHLAASLLQLRGVHAACAPLHAPHSGSVLCFNGEIFGGLLVPAGSNDGDVLLEALEQSLQPGGRSIVSTLSTLQGPWSIAYWQPQTSTLWFGRDLMGRRSLLLHLPDTTNPSLRMTSVAPTPPPQAQITTIPSVSNPAAPSIQQQQQQQSAGTVYVGLKAQVPEDLSTQASFPQCVSISSPADQGSSTYDHSMHTAQGVHQLQLQQSLQASQAQPTSTDSAHAAGPTPDSANTESAPGPAAASALQVDSAAGADGEGEGLEPLGCDGVWTELPTGVYSLVLQPAAAAAAEAASVCAPSSSHNRCVGHFPLGTSGWCMHIQRHAWEDGSLPAHLSAYERAPELLPAESQRPGVVGSAGAGPRVVHDDKGSTRLGDGHAGADVGSSMGDGRDVHTEPGQSTYCDRAQVQQCVGGAESAVHSLGALGRSLRPDTDGAMDLAASMLLNVLQQAVAGQVTAIERASYFSGCSTAKGCASVQGEGWVQARLPAAQVLLLFSGGVDSALLAALAGKALGRGSVVDLSNVCFNDGKSPDRLAARSALDELLCAVPHVQYRLVEVAGSLELVDQHRSHLRTLLRPAGTVMDLNIGAALWLATSAQGTLHLPTAPHSTADGDDPPSSATTSSSSSSCTDRVAQNADSACMLADAGCGTSVSAMPLYCDASSGPHAGPHLEGTAFASSARVVLLGHGADEQCAGYGRHRTRYRNGGWSGLAAELALDVKRMWLRNCGRDDRLVADWGREARHPFLDETFMALCLDLHLGLITDLRLPPGQGDKCILRRALMQLGMPQAAARVKRAIQFGSRIGVLSNRREFGSNRAANKAKAGSAALEHVPGSGPKPPDKFAVKRAWKAQQARERQEQEAASKLMQQA